MSTETHDEVEAELDVSHQEHPPARLQGQCPACGRSILVRNGSGRLWHHGPNNHYRCKGSGADPVEGTVVPRMRASFR